MRAHVHLLSRPVRNVLAALVILLMGARTCRAAYLLTSNFAAVDATSGTGNDSIEFTEADGGGSDASEDADLLTQVTTFMAAAVGGSASTFTALQADLASNESRYVSLFATDRSLSQMAVGFSLHVATAPGVARTVAEIRMGTSGVTRGCFVKLNIDRTLSLYYNTTATSFGTSALTVEAKHCTGDTMLGCDADGDCASTCVASCASNAGCFWPGLELVQINFPAPGGGQVQCELWMNGRAVASDLLSASSLTTITNARIGGTAAGEAGTLAAYFGYVVATDTDRANWGWVGAAYPSGDGGNVAWASDNCGAGTTDARCVDEYTAGGILDTTGLTDVVKATTANRTQDILMTDVDPGTLSVAAVEVVGIARTSGSGTGTGTIQSSILQCTGAACDAASTDPTPETVTYQTEAPIVMTRYLTTTAPGGSAWDTSALADLGMRVTDPTIITNTVLRLQAAVSYVYALRPDAPLPLTLSDHNIGVETCATATDCCPSGCACENGACTKDGVVTVALVGDSTAGGSLQSTCQDGTLCSVVSYCENIAPDAKDIPSYGCMTDAECSTCTLRRTGINGGAGYVCTSDANCGSAGTCGGDSLCTQNDSIGCDDNTDCQGLGTCDEDPNTGTAGDLCVDSCPGQPDCPSRTGWPAFVADTVNADVMYGCGAGGEDVFAMVASRLTGILKGSDSNCNAVTGTGQCSCSVDADCGAGGDCVGSLCTAGETGRTACANAPDCATSFHCVFAPPDYVVVLEGVNDTATGRAPECREPEATQGEADPGSVCAIGSTVLCVTDAECDTDLGGAVSPTSQCLGSVKGAEAAPCFTESIAGPRVTTLGLTCADAAVPCQCSLKSVVCNSNSDVDGCIYSIDSDLCRGTLDSSVTYMQGYCGCTADAQCGNTATWKCVGSMCRRKCSTDADCSTPTRTGACDTGNGVCKGRCTTPCDRTICTTDADCPRKNLVGLDLWPRETAGTCLAGRCSECGPQAASQFPESANAFRRWTKHMTGPLSLVPQYRKAQAVIRTLAHGASNRPIFIPVTVPEYSTDATNPFVGWPDAEYLGRAAMMLRADTINFPHIVDVRQILGARTDQASGFGWGVHLTPTGAEWIGNIVGDYLATMGTCSTGSVTARNWAVQSYCKNNTGTYSSTTCTTSTDCTGAQTCQARPCTGVSDCPDAGDSCHSES